jgi:hypothetical protein
MNALSKLIILLSIVTLISCEKSDEQIVADSDPLIGYWINPVAIGNTTWKYEKADSLKGNNFGFALKSGKSFVERKIAGWCATPPVAFDDFDGTWTKHGSVINITVDYWGGVTDYQWKIISIDNNSLVISKLKEEYHSKE